MQSLPLNNGFRFTKVELKDLPELAQFILDHQASTITLLEAPMGSGKTTLCNAVLKAWGSEQAGSSPTFALIEEYHGTHGKCYHLDAYRIEDEEQAYDMGLEEYLEEGCPMWIEWGGNVRSLLPYVCGVVYILAESEAYRTVEFYPRLAVNEIQWNHE
ncbi:MAG: tRNA (adenosine(37)-N6)-threonylcarbamoyltransferase complex ATPase subunit type 1 TsaE [Schleiferiaceae bacterium]|nr:tRNA (adenosine(37)-N6)-threonylcarbamoyltransferase complex ATPase subunit type 1 TsaE [Schleiferiaceae bacterium]